MKQIFVVFALLLAGTPILYAQNYALGVPKSPYDFEKPADWFSQVGKMEEIYITPTTKSETNAWLVISDRDDNQTYDRPDGSPAKKLSFREYFYVTEERGTWIHIAKGRVSGLRLSDATDYGWIKKSNMLLWRNGLVNANSKIHLKTFLLNRADDISEIIRLERREIVPIFNSPVTNERAQQLYIYSFYFIYKKDKERDRYLIGEEYITHPHNVERVIIGWVPKSRCADWNTRICLEPNIASPAFIERQGNNNLHVLAFKSQEGASTHALTGTVAKQQVYFDKDPAKNLGTDPKKWEVQVANSNPRRYPGSVVRFPMLSSSNTSRNYFRTGVIGEITVKIDRSNGSGGPEIVPMDAQDWVKVLEKFKAETQKFQHYDVLFVVEGTDQMAQFKDAITSAIETVGRELSTVENVRIGVVIYRDPKNGADGRFYEVKKLTPRSEMASVLNFVKETPFSSFSEQDPYTGMYYCLNQALVETDMTKSHSNIVFLIGNNADFRADDDRYDIAEQQSDPTLISAEKIIDNLYALDAHLYVIQCKSKKDNSSKYFCAQGHNFIVQNAIKQYNNYEDLKRTFSDFNIEAPYMADVETGSEISLTRSAIPGAIRKPVGVNALSNAQIVEFVSQSLQKSDKHIHQVDEDLTSMLERGNSLRSVAAGGFAPGILPFLKELIQKSGISADAARNIDDIKYQLYAEVFVPKKINGSNHNTCSYILFMPATDLSEYIALLQRIIDELATATDNERQEKLFDAMYDLMQKYSGEKMTKEQARKVSLNDFIGILQGVKDDGLVIVDQEQNWILDDVMQGRFDYRKLDAFLKRLEEKKTLLERAYRKGKNYEFVYSSGDELYFWIPIEDSF